MKKTAAELYDLKKAEISNLILEVSETLETHEYDFKLGNTHNFGYVGDLEAVKEKLQDIITFLCI